MIRLGISKKGRVATAILHLSFRIRLSRSMKGLCSSAEVMLKLIQIKMNASSSRMGEKALSAEISRILNPLEVYITLVVRMRGIRVTMSSLFISTPV